MEINFFKKEKREIHLSLLNLKKKFKSVSLEITKEEGPFIDGYFLITKFKSKNKNYIDKLRN